MSTPGGVLRYLAKLFVDDGALAIAALLWLLVAALLLPMLIGPDWRGALLFAGLALLLADSVRRA